MKRLSTRFNLLFFCPLFLLCHQQLAQSLPDDIYIVGDSMRNISKSRVLLEGIITNFATGQPIPGASVLIDGLGRGTTTDNKGSYRLLIPVGEYKMIIQHIGMDPLNKRVILYSNGKLSFELGEKPIGLSEVIVEGNVNDSNIKSVFTGVEKLSLKDIKELPSFLGEVDVIKTLLLLPGVNTVGEGATGFNVRGGRIDQNLVLLNGAQLFNSSHVLGFFSVFNPDATEEFTLYKGYIPARFGGRLSSVLDVKMKNGNYEKIKVKGGVGVAASRLVIEGPVKEGKTSFLIGGRSSYSDWILRLARDIDVKNSNASFYDVNANLSHSVNEDNSLSLSFYGSHDKFKFSNQFGYQYQTRLLNFKWESALSQDLLSDFTGVYGIYNSTFFDPEGPDAFNLENGIEYYQLKQNFVYTPFEKHIFNGGAELVIYKNKPEILKPFDENSAIDAEEVTKERGRELSFYISDDITLSRWISFSAGLRYTVFQNVGPDEVFLYSDNSSREVQNITDTIFFEDGDVIKEYSGFEPRLSTRIVLGSSSSLKLSFNRTRQYIHLISNTTSPTPVDIWQVSNTYIPASASNNFFAGYFRNFNNQWETSLEVFYKKTKDLVEYKDFADLFLNEHIETELLAGKGEAYGSELSIKKVEGRWTGWLSYAYTRTFVQVNGDRASERIANGDWFPSNFDQPHNVSLSAKRRLGNKSAFAVNFTYNTGRPISGIVSSYEAGSASVPVFSSRNEYRIPDYIRLDLSFTIADNIWKNRKVKENRRYKDSLTISFYNVLGRKNAFSVFYRRPANSFIPKAHRLSVLGTVFPSLTYNFSF